MKKYICDTLNYYDKNSEKYKDIWNDDFLDNYHFDVPDIFLSYLKPNSYILDLGCGTGRDSKYFISKGYSVKAIDGSEEMCKLSSKLLNMDVQQVNFLDMNYEDLFDGVFACCSLLHLNNKDLNCCLKKIYKSLKNNGILYASFKLGNDCIIKDDRYYNNMTLEKFEDICKDICGFKILRVW